MCSRFLQHPRCWSKTRAWRAKCRLPRLTVWRRSRQQFASRDFFPSHALHCPESERVALENERATKGKEAGVLRSWAPEVIDCAECELYAHSAPLWGVAKPDQLLASVPRFFPFGRSAPSSPRLAFGVLCHQACGVRSRAPTRGRPARASAASPAR